MKRIKLISLMAVALLSTATLFAQTAQTSQEEDEYAGEDVGKRVLLNKWYQNWELSARIGTQAYLGEYCLDVFKFKDWWTLPAIDFNISKWGTQSLGLDFGYTMSPVKTLYQASESTYAAFAKPDDKVYSGNFNLSKGNLGNAYVSVIFDVDNMLFGYRKDRFFNVVAKVGGGILFPTGNVNYRDICASFNAALVNKFAITDHLCVDLAVRGTLHDDGFNGISYYTSGDVNNLSVDASIGATVGISYRFDLPTKKTKAKKTNNEGWTEVNQVVYYTQAYKEVENTVEELEKTVVEKEKVVEEQKASVDSLKQVIVVIENTPVKFSYTQLINFTIDKWDISNREKILVMIAAEAINAHPDVKFTIDGYADKQTSYPEHNQFLSEQRAKAVYDMLVNEYNVNPDQLTTNANGGVDYLYFSDPQCSRSVIIKAVEE